jgi:hypothetical protein
LGKEEERRKDEPSRVTVDSLVLGMAADIHSSDVVGADKGSLVGTVPFGAVLVGAGFAKRRPGRAHERPAVLCKPEKKTSQTRLVKEKK